MKVGSSPERPKSEDIVYNTMATISGERHPHGIQK